MRLPGLVSRMIRRRLLPLFSATLLVAILATVVASQAMAQEATTSSTAAAGQTGIFPTTTTSAPSVFPTTTSAPGVFPTTTSTPSGQAGQPAQAAIVPPPVGQAPLNPGWKTDQLELRVLPEYDRKAVLVIMGFTLPADVPLPATMKFPIPKGAEIVGIGEVDPNGNFKYNTTSYPTITPGAEWDVATVEVKDYRKLQIDYYYDPGLPQGGGQRSFPILAQMPMDVGTVLLHVQHPAGATNFVINPALQGSGPAEDGFTYSVSAYPDVKAGSTLGHTVSYSKPDGSLSIDTTNPGGSSGGSGTTQVNTNTVLLAAILVVVVIVAGAVVYYLFFSQARRGGPQGNGRGARRRNERAGKAVGTKRQGWDDEAQKPAAPKGSSAKAAPSKATTAKTPAGAAATAGVAAAADGAVAAADAAPADGALAASGAAAGAVTDAAAEGDRGTADYCTACGEELSPNSRFCPNCGEAQA